MPLTAEQKADAVGFLTTNCDCWKGKAAVLNGMADEALEVLAADAATAVENSLVVNTLRADLNIPDAVTGDAMAAAVRNKMAGGVKGAAKTGCEDDADEYTDPKAKPAPTGNATPKGGTKMSLRDALQQYGTPDDVAAWNYVVNAERQAKLTVVQDLVANVSDKAERHKLGNRLMKKSIDELEEIRLLRGPVANAAGKDQTPPAKTPRYDGQGADGYSDPVAGVPTANRGGGYGGGDDLLPQDDVLDLPATNMEDLSVVGKRD